MSVQWHRKKVHCTQYVTALSVRGLHDIVLTTQACQKTISQQCMTVLTYAPQEFTA